MRIRTVKPEFFTHEALFELEQETKLPVRLAFIGLWCAADKAGRFKWEPRRLGVNILPYDKHDFSRVLDALTTRGFVVRYACDGALFGAIPSFSRHQVINNREKESDLPEPATADDSDATTTRAPRVPHAGQEEGKGREGEGNGKGMEACAPTNKAKGTVDELRAFAAELGLPANDGDALFHKWEGNGWKNGVAPIKCWRSTMRAWKASGYMPSQKNGGRQPMVVIKEKIVANIITDDDE